MVEREKGSTRPMITRPGSKKPEPYLRASEVHKLIEDKYGLNIWQQDRIGYVVATDDALRNEWANVDVEEKGQAFWDRKNLRDRTIRAYTAGRSWNRQAAAQGTRFHSITDKHDQGALFELDQDYADDLDIYIWALEKAGLHIVASERFVVQDELGIGGTFDKLIAADLPTPDGLPAGNVIADLKTGKVKGKELEFGMQMAVYANSQYYRDGERTPLDANREWGLIIHLPLGSNQVELIWINLRECYEMVKAAITVKEGRKPTFVSAMVISGPTLAERISSAPSKLALVQLYKSNSAEWNNDLNELAQKRSDQLS